MINYTMVIEVDTKTPSDFNRCKTDPTLVGYRRFNARNSQQAMEATDDYVDRLKAKHTQQCGCDSWEFKGMTFETDFAPI